MKWRTANCTQWTTEHIEAMEKKKDTPHKFSVECMETHRGNTQQAEEIRWRVKSNESITRALTVN